MDLEVKVVNILDVRPHNNADNLEIALIHGYDCVIRKNTFKAGDPAVYIPDAAILPDNTLKDLGLWDQGQGIGKLAGPQGNRIHPVRLRGVISQGLLLRSPGIAAGPAVPGRRLRRVLLPRQWPGQCTAQPAGDGAAAPVPRQGQRRRGQGQSRLRPPVEKPAPGRDRGWRWGLRWKSVPSPRARCRCSAPS